MDPCFTYLLQASQLKIAPPGRTFGWLPRSDAIGRAPVTTRRFRQLTGRLVELLLAPGCGWRYQSDWLPVIRGVLE
jgi:hypothetical protein